VANTLNTEALGIHQSDVILRTAIITALNDLRANPWLLEYVFASLVKDDLTVSEYGQKEIDRAKEWFKKTNIPVIYTISVNDPKFPCISIQLVASQEVEQEGTLGDVHYEPQQLNNFDWPTLMGPIDGTYVPATGVITIDLNAVDIILAPTMTVVTRIGSQYPILEVLDTNIFRIQKNVGEDFSQLQVKGMNPSYITEVESAIFKEVYAVGAHVDSEPVHLTYLHSILVFLLKRYNQALLEGRGFERMVINSTDFKRDDETLPEFLYSRYIQITGTCRQAWPKTVAMRITSTLAEAVADDQNGDPAFLDVDADVLDFITNTPPAPTYKVYYGVANNPGAVNEAFALGLAAITVATRDFNVAFDATGTQYCWVVIPAALGVADTINFIDTDTNEVAGFELVGSVVVANTSYYAYRTDQVNLGNLQVKVTR
jgi:hypothetical protein